MTEDIFLFFPDARDIGYEGSISNIQLCCTLLNVSQIFDEVTEHVATKVFPRIFPFALFFLRLVFRFQFFPVFQTHFFLPTAWVTEITFFFRCCCLVLLLLARNEKAYAPKHTMHSHIRIAICFIRVRKWAHFTLHTQYSSLYALRTAQHNPTQRL